MRHVLLLRLVGPMQSWGTQSHFVIRDTGKDPSKSGVVGLLCAALGRSREEPVADLAQLRMAVRVDQEGVMERDYHTVQDVRRSAGKIKPCEVTERFYLADAAFLLGLESDKLGLLEQLQQALLSPHWMLCLGRRAFVPGSPVALPDGLKPNTLLLDALQSYPWQGWLPQQPERLRVVLDDPKGEESRTDVPLSFANRKFAPRRVRTIHIPTPEEPGEQEVS